MVAGASQLCAGADGDTAQIVRAMIDYHGTTAAALRAMDSGFMESVPAALADAAARAAGMAAG